TWRPWHSASSPCARREAPPYGRRCRPLPKRSPPSPMLMRGDEIAPTLGAECGSAASVEIVGPECLAAVGSPGASRCSRHRAGGHAGNGEVRKGAARRLQRAAHIDGAAGILDHDDRKAAAVRILGRVAHAEIEGEAGQEHALKAALA